MNARIITLNLAGFQHGWFEKRSTAVIQGLKALSADVICFQEAVIRSHGEAYNQVGMIAKELGLGSVAFASYGNTTEVVSPTQGGVAIASRWPICYAETRRLPSGHQRPEDHRVALLVALECAQGTLNAATTHLSWEPDAQELRLLQLGVLLEYLDTIGWLKPESPTVVCGDLNATEEEPVIDLITQRLTDAYKATSPTGDGSTWQGSVPYSFPFRHLPDRRLDYIFCTANARVCHAERVLDQPAPVYPSDHFGVLADIAYD